MAGVEGSLSCKVDPQDSLLLACIADIARHTGRPFSPLRLQGLLQLPRVANGDGFVTIAAAEPLLAELAREMPESAEWLVHVSGESPRSLVFGEIDADRSRDVMQRFHYIRSARTDGRSYALCNESGEIAAICVSSPLDVAHLSTLLAAAGRRPDSARVISRVFAFEGAPKNSISYLLARAARMERRYGVIDLVTYLNPNMGFTGASYRASGWRAIGAEPVPAYKYLDRRYITDRELAAQFGRHDEKTYRRLLGSRFAVSTMPLIPLVVFHSQLT